MGLSRSACGYALAGALLVACGTTAALAHGPTRQKVSVTVDVAKPPDQVWAMVKDFDAIAKWDPQIASSPADHGDDVGSKRTLTLKADGSPQIVEELLTYTPDEHSYHYKIVSVDVKVLPVNNYTSWFTVSPGPNGGSTIEWKGAFYRGYMNNDPPAELNDEAARNAVTAVYRAGLDGLKAYVEKGS